MSAQTVEIATEDQLHSASYLSRVEPEPDVATVLICENALLHSGLQQILSGTRFIIRPNISPLVFANDASLEPRLILIAVGSNPDRISEVMKQVKENSPDARIVTLADHFDAKFLIHARDFGIDGFCLTTTDRAVLIKCLDLVMLGEAVLPSKLIGPILCETLEGQELKVSRVPLSLKLNGPSAHKLSAREVEILGCLMSGAPNKVIARQLDVAEATIKVHVKAILRKIGAVNRTQAAMWATEHLPVGSEASLPS